LVLANVVSSVVDVKSFSTALAAFFGVVVAGFPFSLARSCNSDLSSYLAYFEKVFSSMKQINNRASEELQSLTKGNEDRFVLELKAALHKDKDTWRNLISALELIRRTEQTTSEKLDYGDFRLEEQYLTLEEGNRFLEEIEQGKLTINEYSGTIAPYGEAFKFVGSGTTDWFLRVRWPFTNTLYKQAAPLDLETMLSPDSICHNTGMAMMH